MEQKNTIPGYEDSPERLRPSGIHVNQEGDWYYQGDKITRQDVLETFITNLHLVSGGTFVIEWMGQRCTIEVEDTPFIVSRVDRVRSGDDIGEEIVLYLKNLPAREVLDPSTLTIGEGNIPYCTVRSGQFRARFSRPAYYQLASWIEQETRTDTFYLELNGRRYPLEMAAPSS